MLRSPALFGVQFSPGLGKDIQLVGVYTNTLFRVRTKNVGHPYGSLGPVTEEMKEAHGIYCVKIRYDREYRGAWQFGE